MSNDYLVEIQEQTVRGFGLTGKDKHGFVVCVFTPNADTYHLGETVKPDEPITRWFIQESGAATQFLDQAAFHDTKTKARRWAEAMSVSCREKKNNSVYLLAHPNCVWAEHQQTRAVKSSGYAKEDNTLEKRVAKLERAVAALKRK